MPDTVHDRWRTRHFESAPVDREGEGFDELVLGAWFHLEAMAPPGEWWIRIGDARLWVFLTPGAPPRVDVERGVYAAPNGTTLVDPSG